MLQVSQQDREKLIDPLFRVNTRYWLIVFVLLTIIGWGGVMYVRQVSLGLGQTGMQRPSFWGMYMANFIFFIGISHAGTLISAILRVTGAEWRRSITRIAESITVFALIVGTLQIIIDMGRPDRLWSVMLYGRLQSPILWDVVSVTLYFLSSCFYLYLPLIPDIAIVRDNMPEDAPPWRKSMYRTLALGWRGNVEQWRRLERAISIMAIIIIPIAVSVHTIISWILATTVQPGWHSTVFGPYFVVGAIFSGIAALFLVMTAMRRAFHLESYIRLNQYRNLGLLFISMNVVWAYFTYAEHLTLAAGQQTLEFAVLASKLWGNHASSFWVMVALMGFAFWVLVVPKIVPKSLSVQRFGQLSLRYSMATTGIALLILVITDSQFSPVVASTTTVDGTEFAQAMLGLSAIGLFVSLTIWLKNHFVAATTIAGIAVLIGMWLERWNIIVPTMTHPRLIPWGTYTPTLTELSLTAASVALFLLLLVVFFKFFPAVSIWEFAEGRVVEAAKSQTSIPRPEPAQPREKVRRWKFE